MSYKALYRTYRPNTFDEIKGQEHITTTLKNIVKANKVSHAYLFSGPRGTGKTSAAKVFANILNCQDLSQELIPCRKCDYCTSAQVGSSLDVLEMDAASNNGVDDIRDLREKVKYAPSSSRYKVYIIDEVHMLSKGAFNALLKTLEEPPAHVIFILATTEPHKIPITIISRTQRFNFRRIDSSILSKHLVNILEKENMEYDKSAIHLISKIANGGMRDALSIVDQVSAYTNGRITLESIQQVFGVISIDNQINLLNHAASRRIEGLLQLSNQYIDGGADIKRLTMSLIDVIKDFIVYKKTNQAELLESISPEDVTSLKLSIRQAYNMMDVLIDLLSHLSRTEYPRQTFTLAILKLSKSENEKEAPKKIEGVATPIVEAFNKAVNKESVGTTTEVSTNITTNVPNDTKSEVVIEAEDIESLFTTQELNDDKKETPPLVDTVPPAETSSEESPQLEPTQETITQEVSKPEIPKNEETPDDLLSLFNTNTKETVKDITIPKYSVSEIINLLVQTNSEAHLAAKIKWTSILSHSTNPLFSKYVTLLNECKIISTGKTFILISSLKNEIIKAIVDVVEEPNFIEFINSIFGKPLRLFAISKGEFTEVKARYAILSESNNLPEPKPVSLVEMPVKKKTDAEKLGSDLFGDLFSV